MRDSQSSKSLQFFFPQPNGDKSEDTFHASLSAFRTCSDNDLVNKEDFQWTSLTGFEFSFLLLWLLLVLKSDALNLL